MGSFLVDYDVRVFRQFFVLDCPLFAAAAACFDFGPVCFCHRNFLFDLFDFLADAVFGACQPRQSD